MEVSVTLSPVRNPAGEVVGASVIARDIRNRLEAERRLRESEERFRSVFEHAPVGMVWTSATDGQILQANAAVCEMLGYTTEELCQTTWMNLTHPQDLGLSQQMAHRLFADPNTCQEVEKRYLHRLGATVWTRVRMSAICGSDGRPAHFVVHIEDITERRRAQEALRESEERFRIMADGCPSAMWVTDERGGIQFVNRESRRLLGVTYEEVAGERWRALFHPDDGPEYMGAFQKAVEERSPFRAEARIRNSGGDWRWLASYGEPRLSPSGAYLGHVGISPDITERKLAEEALRAAREAAEVAARHHELQHSLVRAIHEGSPLGILAVDRNGIIVSHNRKFLDLWDIAPSGASHSGPQSVAGRSR